MYHSVHTSLERTMNERTTGNDSQTSTSSENSDTSQEIENLFSEDQKLVEINAPSTTTPSDVDKYFTEDLPQPEVNKAKDLAV